ncbi:unnamed protein product [Ceratitis capitata]|uniref:(Mediterranean fruit fly) hypothetical protein n=1 Tax=Ceratitis capitata TaxID=7213 RepID=A0A811UXE1_CERCA|nr:unnamed protein product [Ceratitis capitata]
MACADTDYLVASGDFRRASMDLPPDKAKLLKNYDDEKKWDIICDQSSIASLLPHPPLGSDLATSDYHLCHLKGEIMDYDEIGSVFDLDWKS